MFGGQALVKKEPPNFKVTKTVGLISDTHVPKRAMCIPKRVFEIFENVDYIIHAGDLVELAVVDELETDCASFSGSRQHGWFRSCERSSKT